MIAFLALGGRNSYALFCITADAVVDHGFKCLEGITYNVLQVALGLAGVGLFLMLLVGGLRYITSGGDEKSIDSAKKTLTAALTGFLLVILAYFILKILNDVLGVNLLRIDIPWPTF